MIIIRAFMDWVDQYFSLNHIDLELEAGDFD